MKTPIEQLIEILEDKKSIANGAKVSAIDLLDSCIREAKELAKIPEGTYTKVRLNSGKFFDYANPNADAFEAEDIAKGLATEFRFAGQTDEPYSVAQHAVVCSYQTGTLREQLEWLHHDDSEFIMKDVPKPLKNLLPDYKVIEEKVTEVINKKFGISYPLGESTHRVDKQVFDWEYAGLMLKKFDIEIWDVKTAEKKWLDRHYELLDLIQLEGENQNLPYTMG